MSTDTLFENVSLNYLTIDPRAYRFVKEQSMQNIADAFVELITNSIDAYVTTNHKEFVIDVYIEIAQREIIVTDQAIGMDSEKMKQAFLQVGRYTAEVTSRGYFSRGAKDITALGDVTIVAIKDNKLSKCFINTLGMGALICGDIDVSEQDRLDYKIGGNGLYFSCKLKDSVELNIDRVDNIANHYALRDILSNNKNVVTIHFLNNGVEVSKSRVQYNFIDAEKIVDMEYNINGYDGVSAKFTLYKSNTPIQNQYDNNLNDKYMNFGIIISTDKSIVGNGTLYNPIRYHPYISYLYGRIHCDHINNLMMELDLHTDQYDIVKNPFSIIDPGRVGGLNRTHPFTKELYQKPYERILFVLEQMENLDNDGQEINFSDINDIFNNLDIDSDLLDFEIVDGKDPQLLEKIVESITNTDVIEDTNLEFSKENIELIYNQHKEKITIKPKLHIRFLNKYLKYDYINYKTKDGYRIDVSVPNSLLKNHLTFDEQGKVYGLNSTVAKMHVNYILKEAIARILTNKYFTKASEEANSYGSEYYLDSEIIFNQYEIFSNKIEDQLDEIIIKSTTNI